MENKFLQEVAITLSPTENKPEPDGTNDSENNGAGGPPGAGTPTTGGGGNGSGEE